MEGPGNFFWKESVTLLKFKDDQKIKKTPISQQSPSIMNNQLDIWRALVALYKMTYKMQNDTLSDEARLTKSRAKVRLLKTKVNSKN